MTKRRRIRRVAFIVWVLIAIASGAAVAATGSGPTLPSSDPFYAYSGSLSGIAPGTVLKTRTIAIKGVLAGYSATQVLYRTTGELGQATATVATIIRPLVPLEAGKLISWQTFYDGLGPECRPSYTLQGGNGGYDTSEEEALMLPYLIAGYPIVTADYEGPADEWDAVQESGDGALDGIRAAESVLKLPAAGTPVGMIGYSGGAIATEWAAELAPKYAPQLDIVAAAAGGVQVDPAHNLFYINGSAEWSGVIPPVLLALGHAFGINIDRYASAYGRSLISKVRGGCINNFLGAFPGLTYQKMLKPQYQKIFSIRPLALISNRLIMSTGGTPKAALFLANGNVDGIGDDVMIAGDVEGLAHTYCERGVSVQFAEYKGDAHEEAAIPFEAAALPFLEMRLNGAAASSGCDSIGTGNSLAPLPVPPAPATLIVRYLGVSAASDGLVVNLRAAGGTLANVLVRLIRGTKVVASMRIGQLTGRAQNVVLRVRGAAPRPDRYAITVTQGTTTLARRNVRVH